MSIAVIVSFSLAGVEEQNKMKSNAQQLNVENNTKMLNYLEDLKKRTKVSKRALVEQAVRLLIEQYRTMATVYKNGVVDNQFIMMVNETMKQYGQAMKKLAQ
jgi:hypothetical protein